MSDPLLASMLGAITWVQNEMVNAVRALSEEEFCLPPSPFAPPIGWHLFHVARLADMLQASFQNREQLWEEEELASKIGLDPSRLGLLQMGATQSHGDATHLVTFIGKERLIVYARSVFDLTDEVLRTVTMEDLYTRRESILKIDWRAQPVAEGKGRDVLLFDDLRFHLGHSQRHLGMIEALIGAVFDREGTATI